MSALGIQHVSVEYLCLPSWSPPADVRWLIWKMCSQPAAKLVLRVRGCCFWTSAATEQSSKNRNIGETLFFDASCSSSRRHIYRLIRQMKRVWGNSFAGASSVNTEKLETRLLMSFLAKGFSSNSFKNDEAEKKLQTCKLSWMLPLFHLKITHSSMFHYHLFIFIPVYVEHFSFLLLSHVALLR